MDVIVEGIVVGLVVEGVEGVVVVTVVEGVEGVDVGTVGEGVCVGHPQHLNLIS